MNDDILNLKERWENYRKANTEKPLVRDSELQEVFSLLNPRDGEKILEVGTGNGYLTFPIARAVKNGVVITADVNKDNLNSVLNRNTDHLSIEPFAFDDSVLFKDIKNDTFDAIATIATFHHFDNHKNGKIEEGRISALKEFYRILKNGGRFVMGDVAQNTISQVYFDAIDNPIHCFPEGHPHDFFTTDRLAEVLKSIGFKEVNISVKNVPWKFTSEEEAKNFIHTLHNAKCSVEESFDIAKKYLGFNKVQDHYELGWELFFVIATK